jgi:hypothetical protein
MLWGPPSQVGTTGLLHKVSFATDTQDSIAERNKEIESLEDVTNVPMICVRGPASDLPACAYMAPAYNIMTAGHENASRDKDDKPLNVWLITPFPMTKSKSKAGEPLKSEAQGTVTQESVQNCLKSLFAIMPVVQKAASRLEWMVYTGLKQGVPAGSLPIATSRNFAGITNLAVLFPMV